MAIRPARKDRNTRGERVTPPKTKTGGDGDSIEGVTSPYKDNWIAARGRARSDGKTTARTAPIISSPDSPQGHPS